MLVIASAKAVLSCFTQLTDAVALHCFVDNGRQERRFCNLGDVSLQDAAAGEVHTLPDGQSITIEGEGQQLAQALLNPSRLGKDLSDLPSATVTQIMQHPDGPTRKVLMLKLDIVSAEHSWCWTLLAGHCGYQTVASVGARPA